MELLRIIIKKIKELLPFNNVVTGEEFLIIYDPVTDSTYKVKVSAIRGGENKALKWVDNQEYNENDIVEWNLKLWKSLIDENEGNIPTEGLIWTEVSRSEAGNFGYWSAGVFTVDPTIVIVSGQLYWLDNTVVSIPFESIDFAAELAANKWKLISGSSGGGVTTHSELTGKNDEEEFQHIELADKTKIVGLIDKIDPVLGVSTKFLNEKGDFVPVATTAIGVQGRDFFARSINSDIVGYKTLSNDADSSESIVSITAQSSDGIVWGDKYLTDAFVDGKTIRSAAWGFDYWRLVSSVVGVSRKHLRVFIYRAGVEIDVLTLQSSEIDDTEFTERQVSYVFQEVVLQPNDRLGIQEGFSTAHASNITFQYIIGDGRSWFMRIPVDLEHKDLVDKNGEAAFQHVTLTEKNNYNAHINGADEVKHGASQISTVGGGTVQSELNSFNRYPFAFSGIESFKILFGKALTFTGVDKAASITDLRVGKNGATPTTMTFPYTVIDTDVLEFAATYDRYSDSYFTLKT